MRAFLQHGVAAQRFLLRHLILFLAAVGLLNVIGLHSVHLSVTDNSVTFSFVSEADYGGELRTSAMSIEKSARERDLQQDETPTTGAMPAPKEQLTDPQDASDQPQLLNFYIAAFPKCGTTTLAHLFANHKETAIHESYEECRLARTKVIKAKRANREITRHLKSLSTDPNVKRGIKCPIGLKFPDSVERTQSLFPNTKLIIGLRHPVSFFQSFYNYRVKERYKEMNSTANSVKQPLPPPSLDRLIFSKEVWKGLNSREARFEQFLKFLGKTNTSKHPKTPFKVFLYTLEQLEDTDEGRKDEFRRELQAFLELKQPIPPFPRVNANKNAVGRFNGTIDLCDAKNDKHRAKLILNAKETQRWIMEEFMASPDVTVANAGHFRDLLQAWGSDPCGST